MNRKADLCIMFASFIILAEGNTVTLLPDGYADVVSGMPLSLQCVYSGTNNPFTFNFYFNQSTNGLQIRVSNCLIFSAVGYNTSLYNRSCGTNNVSLIILAVPQEHDGQKWECDVSFTTVVPIPPKASTILRVTAATTPATTPTTSPPCWCKQGWCTGFIVSDGILVFAVIVGIIIFCIFCRRKKYRKKQKCSKILILVIIILVVIIIAIVSVLVWFACSTCRIG